jgi:hypothetical protein
MGMPHPRLRELTECVERLLRQLDLPLPVTVLGRESEAPAVFLGNRYFLRPAPGGWQLWYLEYHREEWPSVAGLVVKEGETLSLPAAASALILAFLLDRKAMLALLATMEECR